MMSPETTLPMPFAVPDGGFLESHDDLFSLLEQFNTSPSQNPVSSGNSAGSIEPDPAGTIADERKRRRMISNRESARRSRMRKQRHLEGLRNQVNRFKAENKEFANRLAVVSNHYHLVSRENNRFRTEAFRLRQRLSDLNRFLITRQLQQQILFSSNEQIPQLIA